jgi:hypothetical protein
MQGSFGMSILFTEKNNRLLWYMSIFLYSGVLIFLALSLFSYNATDSSWFYVSTDPGVISNWCGFCGAQISALLFYLLGGASYLLFIPLLWIGYIWLLCKPLKTEWERLCAALYVVFVAAAFFATYLIDCAWSPYPGGIVGLLFAQKLLYYFDAVGRALFLYMSMGAVIVLLCRWSFMTVVSKCMAAAIAIGALLQKYKVVQKIAHALKVVLYAVCIRFPFLVAQFIMSLINGQAFDDTGLLVPEEENDCYQYDAQHHIDDNIVTDTQLHYHVLLASIKRDNVQLKKNNCMPPVLASKKTKGATKVVQTRAPKKVVSTLSRITNYALPHKNIFIADKQHYSTNDNLEKELQERAHVLQDKLKRFGVHGQVIAIKRGPVVTLFEYQPDIDTKISKIIVLEDDLAMALQAMSIRIIAPIPGKSVVGFEVANTTRHDVLFAETATSAVYAQFEGSLPLILGKGTVGEVVVVDLARMPHLLIAGSTGSGKSVALNAILISLLCKLSPDELKLILIDPKRLEFAAFTDIAHLLFPIVTSPYQAAPVLRWVVQEMEERYEKMAQCGARNITDYNARVQALRNEQETALPFIVVMIDELADLMITAGRDIEDLITRITQMARAAGIHMIVATQRPSVDVITGLIKANFPSRISFRVASRIDSRTILDTMGADRLLGRGDMLFIDASTSQLRRVHGAYVSDAEIEAVADHIRKQRKVAYLDMQQVTVLQDHDLSAPDDILYKDVRLFLNEIDEVSISLLQRKFRIGYNRSARIIDMLESQGLIMPQDGSKTRKVIR